MAIEDGSGLPGGREEMLEIIAKFRLIDDTFMTKVFEDKECAELLLRVILDRDDLTVEKTETQFELKNMYGRSTRLDIYAEDTKGKKYNIEVQRDNGGASPRRARYHSSLIDANSLRPGRRLKKLGETYVVFITEHDVLKGGKPIYTIERKIQELDNKIFGDGSHIIYVNGEIRDNTKLGRLMWDFFCADPHKMHNEVLAERTKYFKESDEGVDFMCKLMDDYGKKNRKKGEEIGRKKGERIGRKKGIEEGVQIGSRNAATEFARSLWSDGICDFERIAKLSKLPLDEVKKLLEKNSN